MKTFFVLSIISFAVSKVGKVLFITFHKNLLKLKMFQNQFIASPKTAESTLSTHSTHLPANASATYRVHFVNSRKKSTLQLAPVTALSSNVQQTSKWIQRLAPAFVIQTWKNCFPPRVLNPKTCSCGCQPRNCGINPFFTQNGITCECGCNTSSPLCKPPKRINPKTCTCECPTKCTGFFTLDKNTCKCVCQPRNCGINPQYVLNLSTCNCERIMTPILKNK